MDVDLKFRRKSPRRDPERSTPNHALMHGKNYVQDAHTDAGVSELCPSSADIPFAPGAVVEITQGMGKGLRGVVLGAARSMYRGIADVALRMEIGREAWIRPDYLRQLAPAPSPSDDDVMSPLRKVRCP